MEERRVDLFNLLKCSVCFLQFFLSIFSFILFVLVQTLSFSQLNNNSSHKQRMRVYKPGLSLSGILLLT